MAMFLLSTGNTLLYLFALAFALVSARFALFFLFFSFYYFRSGSIVFLHPFVSFILFSQNGLPWAVDQHLSFWTPPLIWVSLSEEALILTPNAQNLTTTRNRARREAQLSAAVSLSCRTVRSTRSTAHCTCVAGSYGSVRLFKRPYSGQ